MYYISQYFVFVVSGFFKFHEVGMLIVILESEFWKFLLKLMLHDAKFFESFGWPLIKIMSIADFANHRNYFKCQKQLYILTYILVGIIWNFICSYLIIKIPFFCDEILSIFVCKQIRLILTKNHKIIFSEMKGWIR